MKGVFYLFLLFFIVEAKAQKILNDDYYMVSIDDTKMYRQSQDTLYQYHCSPEFKPRFDTVPRHYKILNTQTNANITWLKLERLDHLQMSSEPFPLNRFFVLVLKDLNSKTAGQLMFANNLTRAQLDAFTIPLEDLSHKFYSTLISNTYKNELATLKSIATKQDINILLDEMKSEKYKEMISQYQATKINDMYGSLLTSELFYRSFLAKGYNPIGSGLKFNELQKQK